MTPTVRVSVGTWTCCTAPLETGNLGATWILTNLDGWYGGLDIRTAAVDVMQGDGALSGPVRLAARTVTVEGSVLTTTRLLLATAMETLDILLTGGTRVDDLIVDEILRGAKRKASVHLAGPTMIKRTGPRSADFSLSLLAPDPTRHPA